MNEDYLWNGTGESDPEIARLEETLRPLRYQPDFSRLRFPAANATPPPFRRWRWQWAAALACAAMIAVGVIGISINSRHAPTPSAWKLSWSDSSTEVLNNGQVIDTGHSAARLESEFIGEVNVAPESRLRVIASTRDEQRLALEHGTIHALIWAPPAQFVVDTPSASTIDLGCQYTLQVDRDGSGVLQVQMGWVAFEWQKLESFIPASAECKTRATRGPGVPYFEDASPQLRAAVTRFDADRDRDALEAILTNARPRDGLTLWHLLARTQGEERGEVFDRFQSLVKLAPQITRDKILSGDPTAMDAAWNALDLGDTSWWREWKRKW